MATKDWNGFKKSGDTYIPNDATARADITAIKDGTNIDSFGDVETALSGKADKVVRELTSSDDLDTITEYGTYVIKTSPTHAPESADYCSLLVTPSSTIGTGAVIQTVIRYDRIYTRRMSSGTWSSWYKFTGTALS